MTAPHSLHARPDIRTMNPSYSFRLVAHTYVRFVWHAATVKCWQHPLQVDDLRHDNVQTDMDAHICIQNTTINTDRTDLPCFLFSGTKCNCTAMAWPFTCHCSDNNHTEHTIPVTHLCGTHTRAAFQSHCSGVYYSTQGNSIHDFMI